MLARAPGGVEQLRATPTYSNKHSWGSSEALRTDSGLLGKYYFGNLNFRIADDAEVDGDKPVSGGQSVLRVFSESDAPTRSLESNSRRRQSEVKG
jgi:hypothetical protein